jgi:hypothetical protein
LLHVSPEMGAWTAIFDCPAGSSLAPHIHNEQDVRGNPIVTQEISAYNANVPVDSERETFMKSLSALGTVIVSTFLANSPVQAHHSFAMFDETKNVVLKGTVAEFQWTNPHSWILMMVSHAQGQPEPWAIQLDAPGALARQGWFPKSLTPGMKVTAVIHPSSTAACGAASTWP